MSKSLEKTNDNAATAIAQPAGGSVSGNIDQSDLVIPSIKLVQKTGELGELFVPGSWVLNNEFVLHGARADDPVCKADAPVRLTVALIRKSYIENVEYGSDEIPDTAHTLDEVHTKGGSLDWGEEDSSPPSWNAIASATVLVRGEDEAYFPFEFEKKRYAMAIWSLRGTAYREAARPILTAASYNLKSGLEYGSWSLSSKIKKRKNNSWFVPDLKTGEKNDEKFAAWARELTR